MFWWFERGGELLRLEVLQVTSDRYELRVIQSDGTENVETFASAQDLNRRQEQVQRRVAEEGWNGPRWGSFHDYPAWESYLVGAGFLPLHHYYRPPGLPREQQPWLASVWRKPSP